MLEVVSLAWSSVVAAVSLVAAARSSLRAPRRAQALAVDAMVAPCDVLMVRPCAGAEPMLEQSLRSSIEAASRARASVVFAVASATDAATPVAERVASELRAAGVQADVVVTGASCANAKSGQLAAVIEGRAGLDRDAVVVVADSDVLLAPDDLVRLVEAFEAPRVVATWAPPVEVSAPHTFGDRASQAVLCGSLHAFPLLSRLDEAGMVGKLFAVRSGALADVGGFSSLTDVLGEDMELARRLRARGGRVRVVDAVARSAACGRSLAATLDRYARWLLVIRGQRPWLLPSYPLLFASLLPLIALSLVAPAGPWSLAAVVVALAARFIAASAARRLVSGRFLLVTPWVDVMLSEPLLLAAFFKALSRRTLTWRGRSLSLARGGRLVLARAATALVAFTLALTLALSQAMAIPTVGAQGKNVYLEDADGKVIELETMLGKPILLMYEDKDSGKQNQPFKDELAKLAKGDKYKSRINLAAVADLTSYNYWPVKGFVKDAIKKESKKFGTTIFCDWTGQIRTTYSFKKNVSSVVLLNKVGTVIFAVEGAMSPEQRKQAIDMLRAQVDEAS